MKIKKGKLNYDQSGRAYPPNPRVKENWSCIWEYEGKYYKLVGDNEHKEWDEVNIYNQIINEAYENYYEYMRDDRQWELDKEEFINKCKTDNEFSEKWGLQIEERELSLEEREDLKLKLILEYLNKKGIITSSFEDFKKDENIIQNIDWRREVCGLIGWIDYGNEVKRNRLEEIYDDVKNIPTKLITLTYNNEKIESYE